MEVLINDYESYKIEMPEKVTLAELGGVVERLKNVLKINANSLMGINANRYIPVNKQSSKVMRINGEKPQSIEGMKLFVSHYAENRHKTDKKKLADDLSKMLSKYGFNRKFNPETLVNINWEFRKRLENAATNSS